MLDVIKAQIKAAHASTVAALAIVHAGGEQTIVPQLEAVNATILAAMSLIDLLQPSAEQAAREDAARTERAAKPAAFVCCRDPEPMPVPGFPGVTVCQNCDHNEGEQSA